MTMTVREDAVMNISFCENNEGSGRVFTRLKADYPALDIQRCRCLKKCGICNCTLFALVGDTPVRGKNAGDLYLKITELFES